MSLYLVKTGKYRVKELNCGRKLQKRLENLGFRPNCVVEKLYASQFDHRHEYLTEEGKISLGRTLANSIIVEKV